MAAHRKSDQNRDDLRGGGLRKSGSSIAPALDIQSLFHCIVERKRDRIRRMNLRKATLLVLVTTSASLALADDFKTNNGKEYKNAIVTQIDADGIVVKTKTGISKLYFTELPEDVQKQYHYNPANAAAAQSAQVAAIERTNQQIEEANKQREKEKQVALESSRRATEEAAKAQQNTTIEPGNKTGATRRHVVGVGGVNGLEVETSQKELQLEAAAREEGMSPEQKKSKYEQDMKTYDAAKQTAARRGLDSNKIVPPRYGQLDYAPFANLVR
jgi:type IV secretory pathway VirB10-like protein